MGGKVTACAAGFAAGSHSLRLKGAVPLSTLPSSCHFQGQQHQQMTIQAGLLPTAGPSRSQEWPWLSEAPGSWAPRRAAHSHQPSHPDKQWVPGPS